MIQNIAHAYFQEASKNKLGCYFCDPFKGSIVHESENFVVLLDTFPITQGHLMISSKKHYGCAGEIPNEWMPELLCIKDDLRKQIEKFGKKAIFYEHGRAGCCIESNPDGSKCEHFHLHCLPTDISIVLYLNDMFENHKLTSYTDITERFAEEGNYLYFEDRKGDMNFYPAEEKEIESHLLRTMICKALGTPELSNWQNCVDAELYVMNYAWAKEVLKCALS